MLSAQLTAWTFSGWLLLAFGVFDVFLNLLAELTGFADRQFFTVRSSAPALLQPLCLKLELCLSLVMSKNPHSMRQTHTAGVSCTLPHCLPYSLPSLSYSLKCCCAVFQPAQSRVGATRTTLWP